MIAKKSTPKPPQKTQKKTASNSAQEKKSAVSKGEKQKSVTQREVLDAPVPASCPQGGEHEWAADACAKCHEPKPEADVAATEGALDSSPETPAVDTAPKKSPRAPKSKSEPKTKKLSALDAAAKVLEESGEPMTTRQMVEAMAAKGYWSSPNGQTPAATLYSAILRQITTMGKDARFKKTDRGQFAFNG